MKFRVSIVGHYECIVEVEARDEEQARFIAPQAAGQRRMGELEKLSIDDIVVQPVPTGENSK